MKLIPGSPGPGISGLIIFLIFLLPSQLNGQTQDGALHLPDDFTTPYVKINKIEITGNKRTKEKIITRELDFKQGDSLAVELNKSAYSVGKGQKRFSRTGFKRSRSAFKIQQGEHHQHQAFPGGRPLPGTDKGR